MKNVFVILLSAAFVFLLLTVGAVNADESGVGSGKNDQSPWISSGLTLPVFKFSWIRTTIDPEGPEKDRLRVQADALAAGIGYQVNFHIPGTYKKTDDKFTHWFYPSLAFLGFTNIYSGGNSESDDENAGEDEVVELPDDQKIKQQYSAGLLFNFYNGWITIGATADLLKEIGDRQTGFLAQYHKDTREGWQGLENISIIIGFNIPIGVSSSEGATSWDTQKKLAPATKSN